MNATPKASVAPKKLYSDTTRVGLGYSVRFELRLEADATEPLRLDAEWSPCTPQGRDKRRVLERYRQGRDRFVGDACKRLGVSASVVEVF